MQTSDNAAGATLANPLDRFSIQRVKMVARYYYPMFRKQLLIYPLVGLLVGVLFHLRELLTMFDVFFGLLSLAMSFMVLWAPIVLTGKDRTTEILLPARWSEKAVVLLGYFLVILPLITNGAYYLSNALITFLRTDSFLIHNPLTSHTFSELAISDWITYPLSYLNTIFPISIFLFIVCRSARAKAWQGLLFSVLSNFAIGIAVGIFVVMKIFSFLPDLEPGTLSQPEIERTVLQSIDFNTPILITAVVLSLGSIIFIGLTLRAIRKVQA
ncbi:MAG: hypothetical protein HDR89_06555 [Bacteroides sp.]|nr:hypothetical protein [Bacteroides sp.]